MKLIVTLSLFLLPLFIFGNIHGDSLNYLTPQDSVFLTVDANNQKIIEHKLEKKQTMYSLAKFYGLEVVEVFYFNRELEKMNAIPVGSMIQIPIPNKAIKRYQRKDFDPEKHAAIYYRVQKGNTLYHISKRLFKMPIEDVQKRNNLPDTNIHPGQLLLVGWISTEGVPREHRRTKPVPPEWRTSQLNGNSYLQAKGIKREYGERGAAAWSRNSKNSTDIYALHGSAPINSIIEVTNPMNKRILFVKVTGRPSNKVYYGTNVIIVLSKKAAQMLGARDPRFFVHIKYLK